jgi:hypothetical protein
LEYINCIVNQNYAQLRQLLDQQKQVVLIVSDHWVLRRFDLRQKMLVDENESP